MIIHAETDNAYRYVILRIHGHPSKPSHRSSLRSRLYKYMYGRISGGSLGSEGLFQYVRSEILNYIFKH